MADPAISFPLAIITPAGAAAERDVAALILSATGGRMSVLPRHMPIMAALDAGETLLTRPDGITETWQSGSGTLSVDRAGKATLLLNRWDASKETH